MRTWTSVCRRLAPVPAAFVALGLVFVPWSLRASHTPRGRVDQPRLQAFPATPANDSALRFSGLVDFPGTRGFVVIEVMRNGNADSSNEANWRQAAFAFPGNTPEIVVGDLRFFRWSTGPLHVFRTDDPDDNPWPEGGTTRLRFRAVFRHADGSRSQAFLPVMDTDSVFGRTHELVLADRDPTPAELPPDQTPDYLGFGPPGTPEATDGYYDNVGTGPLGGQAGPGNQSIRQALGTLTAFRRRYFGPIPADCPNPSQPLLLARYFNRGDLGIGREMHCIRNGCTQEAACFVRNYGGLDDNGEAAVLFNRIGESFEALRANKPFATVAMVERGQMPLRAPHKMIFVVYDANGELLNEAQLDNKGFNKSIPGNCLTCHGSADDFRNGEVRSAFFLPFDLDAFQFYSSDPASPLSREAQETAFQRLNRLVYFSDLYFNRDANELINGWYGGAIVFPSPTFQGHFVPRQWRESANTRQIYRHVVAATCRTCHISHTQDLVANLTFGSFAQFEALAPLVHTRVCVDHSMPNAEQTLNLFWRGTARPQLLNRMALPLGCQPVPPGAGAAAISHSAADGVAMGAPTLLSLKGLEASGGQMAPSESERVLLDYKNAICSCATAACARDTGARYVGEVARIDLRDRGVRSIFDAVAADVVACLQPVWR